MKKILIFALALCLLLASCSSETEQSTPKGEENPEKVIYEELSPNEFKIIGDLPDIGEFSGKSDAGRFYDEITYDFIPSDEYGTVVPYVDSYRVYETEGSDWHIEQSYGSYGFCTPDGKIVMDASYRNAYVNYNETDDGFGYYVMSREINVKDDAPDEYMPSEQLVIPKDGSWCLTLDGERMWISSAGGGYLSVIEYPEYESDDVVKTLLYDYNGNLVKTLYGIDSTGIYSQGLLMVSEYRDNNYYTWFLNENSNIELGPFKSATNFNEYGIACVSDELGEYLINTEGERLTGYYNNIYREYNSETDKSLYSARHNGNSKKLDIYAADGNLLSTIEGASYVSFKFPDNGDIYYCYTSYDTNEKGQIDYGRERMIWKRLGDDAELVSKEFGVSPNSYSSTDNCFVHLDKQNGIAYVFDVNGETIAVLDGGVTEILALSEFGEYIVYQTGEYEYKYDEVLGNISTDTRKTYIYDSKKKQNVYEIEKGTSAYYMSDGSRYIMINSFDEFDLLGGSESCWLFDAEAGKVVFQECENISITQIGEKTYINVCGNNFSALYDEKLNIIRKTYYE